MRCVIKSLFAQLLVLLLLIICGFGNHNVYAAADGEAAASEASILSMDELSKMSVKQLRSLLTQKGQECRGCAEKADFVAQAFEAQSLPDAETSTSSSEPEPKEGSDAKLDEQQLNDLLEKMKQQGFGNSRMFRAEDMKGKTPEELSEMFGGKSSKPKKGQKRSKKSDNSKSKSSGSGSSSSGGSKLKMKGAKSTADETIEL